MNEVVDLRDTGRRPSPVAEVGDGLTPDDVVAELNQRYALVIVGSKAIVVEDAVAEDGTPEDRFLLVEAFKLLHGNRFVRTHNQRGDVVSKSWAAVWLTHRDRRTYVGVTFAPDTRACPPGYYNLWRGFLVEPRQKANGYPTFRQHLVDNVCGGREDLFRWLFAWLASIVQRPMDLDGTAVALRGVPGCGKSKVGEVMGWLLGRSHVLVDQPGQVTGHFNAHLRHCLLLQVDEGFWAGDKAAEGRLKGMITASKIMIEPKGVDAIPVRNLLRMLVTSNEDFVVPAALDDRRWFVLDVAKTRARDVRYFRQIDHEMLREGGLQALLFDLLNADLSGINLRDPPMTEGKALQKLEGLDDIHQWWFQCLHRGWIHSASDGWPKDDNGIVSSQFYDSYLAMLDKQNVKSRRSVETKVALKLRDICPGMRSGKVVSYATTPPRRVQGYYPPPLPDARREFEMALGHMLDWPAEDEVMASAGEGAGAFDLDH